MDVDYDDPTFKELVADFLCGDELIEEVNIANFVEFHRERANLQLLCKKCHKKKTKESYNILVKVQ